MKHILQQIVEDNRAGKGTGIYSVCSANEYVLRAAISKGVKYHTPVLIEATANQVDQFGGYSGMTPRKFYEWVQGLATEMGLPEELLILGGDHLGPLTFANRPESEAMELAKTLVYEYAKAGFTKIHLDTSMRVADDDQNARLSDEVIARRGAALCVCAEEGFRERQKEYPDAQRPVYIIGSEVPIPGGEQEETSSITPTKPADLEHTYRTFEKAFEDAGVSEAFDRVIGVVVQPGVEFGSEAVFVFDRDNAKDITTAAKSYPHIVLEGHSTDYQPRFALRNMVLDGVGILKVGPALTFACREGLFALEGVEKELHARGRITSCSDFRGALEKAMLADDHNWKKYYPGDENEQAYQRAYSLSDRARYYMATEQVTKAAKTLLQNLTETEIPYALLSQYLPLQAWRVREGIVSNDAQSILLDHIGDMMEDYLYATGVTETAAL